MRTGHGEWMASVGRRGAPVCALAAVAALLGLAAGGAAVELSGGNLVLNGDFGLDSDGDGMADHWSYSGDPGAATVAWRREEMGPGRYAQTLVCTRFVKRGPWSHVMLAQDDAFGLEQGRRYRLSFRARGEVSGRAAHAAIQETGVWEGLGLSEMFRVTSEWRRHEFVFRARKTVSERVRLQIWYEGTGELSIADVELTPVGEEEAVRRYRAVVPDIGASNLVPNSSFECGASGWGTVMPDGWWGVSGPVTLFGRVDPEVSAQHGSSFRIELERASAPVYAWDYYHAVRRPLLAPLAANRGWISVEPGAAYTFSAYVRAAEAGTRCTMGVYQAFRGTLWHACEAGPSWQRVTFTFRPTADQVFVAIGPDLRESDREQATLWVDGVQLERGETATDYEPRALVEAGLEWERPGHLFGSPGEARAAVWAANGSGRRARVRLRARVTDFFDRPAGAPEVTLELGPGEARRAALPLGVGRKGYYGLELEAEEAELVGVGRERFAVVDPPEDEEGLFGMNHAYCQQELLGLSREIGLTWFRDWSLKWGEVEPRKGEFTFEEADYQIERVLREGLKVLALLPFPSAGWSSAAPEGFESSAGLPDPAVAYRPRDPGEFADYAREMVRRYSDRVRVWEILNEPLYTGYALPRQAGHTAEDYVALLRAAYVAIKEMYPKAFVVGGIAADPTTLLEEFIAAGGPEWLDAYNIHIYPVLQHPERYLAELERMNEMLLEAGRAVPIWFTEGAYYGDDDLATEPYQPGDPLLRPLESELLCASYQARFNMILLSQNVRRIIYHAGAVGPLNDDYPGGIFFTWDGAPRKMAAAQAAMSGLLGPDTEYVGSLWERPRSFAFRSRGRTVVGLWDEEGEGRTLETAAAAPVQVLDLVGAQVEEARVTLGETPYYVVVEGAPGLGKLRALVGERVR